MIHVDDDCVASLLTFTDVADAAVLTKLYM